MSKERVFTGLNDNKKYVLPDEDVGLNVASVIEERRTELTTWLAALISIVFTFGGTFLLVEIQKTAATRNSYLLYFGILGISLALVSLGFGIASYLSQLRGLQTNPNHLYLLTEARQQLCVAETRFEGGKGGILAVPNESWAASLESHQRWVRARTVLMWLQLTTFILSLVTVAIVVFGMVASI